MTNKKSIVILTVAAVMLGACSLTHPPKPVLPERYTLTPGETITVGEKPTIYAVAREHNVSMRDIIVLNNLQPPFALRAGQKLVLPAGGSIYGSPTFSSNGVASAPVSSVSSVGIGSGVEAQELPPPPVAPVAPLAPAPSASASSSAPSKYVAKQTQVDVLNRPSVAPQPVATTMNGRVNGGTAAPTLVTPTVAPTVAPTAAPVAVAAPQVITPAAQELAKVDPSQDADAPPPDFVWPVQGPVLSSFGPKGQGLNNDGVNIGAPKGSPVVAAAGGIVVYAGNEMKGFGNLILIRHEGGWVTAYAHLDRVLVAKDAVVASGDMIGTVGKTGTATSSQVHFEIRHNSKPVDPTSLIKA